MTQWNYTSPQTATTNTARVTSINLIIADGSVEINYVWGELNAGNFTQRGFGVARIPPASVPANITTLMTTLTTRAFTYLNAQGLIPAGTEVP